MENSFLETQRFNKWWYIFLIGIITINIYYMIKLEATDVTQFSWWCSFLIPIVVLFFFLFFRLDTKINREGIYFRFFPLITKRFSWDEISEVNIRTYKPIGEFMGWGIRYGLNGVRGFTTKGNIGLQIDLNTGKKYLLGTQIPDELIKICNQFLTKNHE